MGEEPEQNTCLVATSNDLKNQTLHEAIKGCHKHLKAIKNSFLGSSRTKNIDLMFKVWKNMEPI